MSWQSKVLQLVKKYGAPAKFAATTILNAVIPGSPAVISLVEKAFDTAGKTAQDDWELDLSRKLQTTNENQERLEKILDVLGGELATLFEQVAKLEKLPAAARQLIETSRKTDESLRNAIHKIDAVVLRFDRLEEMSSQVLAGQQIALMKLDAISSSLNGKPDEDQKSFYDAVCAGLDEYYASIAKNVDRLLEKCCETMQQKEHFRLDASKPQFVEQVSQFEENIEQSLFKGLLFHINSAAMVNRQLPLKADDAETLKSRLKTPLTLSIKLEKKDQGLLAAGAAGAAIGAGVGSIVPVVGTISGLLVGTIAGMLGGEKIDSKTYRDLVAAALRRELNYFILDLVATKPGAISVILEKCLQRKAS